MKINNGDLEIFVAQVAPGQNQHTKNASWGDAWGDRVKIRIPGKHTETSEIKDDDLPWAIVSKSTGTGHFNRASSGIWGGEWVLCIHNPKISQEPTIIGNYGRAANMPEIVTSTNGTTAFKDVSTYNGGLQAGNHQITGGSSKRSDPRTLPVGSDIKDDAKTDPTSQTVTENGVPKEPIITVNEDGSKTVTIVDGDGNKTNYPFKQGQEISPGTLKNFNKMQETNFNLQMSKEATLRGDDAAATYFSNKAAGRDTPLSAYRQQPSFEQQVAQYRPDYTAKDKAEDKLLLRSIQRGELGPVPRDQIDAIINRINGVGGLVRGV
jgi:hypothetical protein